MFAQKSKCLISRVTHVKKKNLTHPEAAKLATLQSRLYLKTKVPGSSNDTLCTYCNAGPETQQHIMMECTGFDDLTGEASLNQLDKNQNLDFEKEADIICKVIDRIKLGQQTNQNHTDEITQSTDSGTFMCLDSMDTSQHTNIQHNQHI